MRVFSIAMSTRFRGVTRREGVLLRGPAGWGEFSPFAEYGPEEAARWLAAARESAFEGWPAPVRDRVPVNVTVPAVGPERAFEMVRASGCRTAKVKVAERGQGDADDMARVEAVRDALGPEGRVRVDVNGGWDVEHAVRMVRALDRFDLEYVEQPCMSLEELAAVRLRVDVPVAADESIRRAEDPLKVKAAGAADVAVLKVQPLGGVRAALRVAEATGLPVVVSSAVETSVGLAAGVALAAALPELPFACGLGTLSLLTGDVVDDPLAPVGGEIAVRRPGVGEAALAAVEADLEVAAAWRERLGEAEKVLAAAGDGASGYLSSLPSASGAASGAAGDVVDVAREGDVR
ncbi:o-succinylbenzoate synthase [Spirillospora sp. NPDC052269]